MRTFFAILLSCGLIIVLAVFQPVHATGNVLLPSSNGPQPNLGLVPVAPPQAPAATDTDKTQTPAAAVPAPTPAPASTQTGTAPATNSAQPYLPYTPAPSSGAAAPRTTSSLKIPTRVVVVPDNSILQDTSKMGANSIAMDLDTKSAWGTKDISAVSQKLGIAPNDVPKSCSVSLNGFLKSDKGAKMFASAGSPAHALIGYDGKITGIQIGVTALCQANKLPSDSGFVTQVGNRYSVPVGSITCPQPASAARQVVLLYNNGSGSCSYIK